MRRALAAQCFRRKNPLRNQRVFLLTGDSNHVAWMPHFTAFCTPANEKSNPIQVNFFSVEAIVKVSQTLPHLIHQARGTHRRDGDFHDFTYNCIFVQYMYHKTNRQAGSSGFEPPTYTASTDLIGKFCDINYVPIDG
jgi:hypothetical protein